MSHTRERETHAMSVHMQGSPSVGQSLSVLLFSEVELSQLRRENLCVYGLQR